MASDAQKFGVDGGNRTRISGLEDQSSCPLSYIHANYQTGGNAIANERARYYLRRFAIGFTRGQNLF